MTRSTSFARTNRSPSLRPLHATCTNDRYGLHLVDGLRLTQKNFDDVISEVAAAIDRAAPLFLVQSVCAVAIGIAEDARHPVGRNACRSEERAVRRARRHGRHYRRTWPVFRRQLFHGSEHLRIQSLRALGYFA